MPQLTFEGTVFSGKGEGKKFIQLPWVKRQIEEKLSFTPYAGTLNIRLTSKSAKNRKPLQYAKVQEIIPEAGYSSGILIKAKIGKADGAIVIPQIPRYSNDVLELIAPICLREKLGLVDGNIVTVTVAF